MGLKSQAGFEGVRILSGVDYEIEEAFDESDGILMGAATILPELYVLAADLYHQGQSNPTVMKQFRRLVRHMQSVATHQFQPSVYQHDEKDLFDVGGYRNMTAMYLVEQGTIESAAQPQGTEERHLRSDGQQEAVRANLILLRQALREIGKDPDIVYLAA